MDGSSIVSLVMIVVAMAAGLVTFGLLRERGRAALTAGCASAVVAVGVVACFVLFSVVRVITG